MKTATNNFYLFFSVPGTRQNKHSPQNYITIYNMKTNINRERVLVLVNWRFRPTIRLIKYYKVFSYWLLRIIFRRDILEQKCRETFLDQNVILFSQKCYYDVLLVDIDLFIVKISYLFVEQKFIVDVTFFFTFIRRDISLFLYYVRIVIIVEKKYKNF